MGGGQRAASSQPSALRQRLVRLWRPRPSGSWRAKLRARLGFPTPAGEDDSRRAIDRSARSVRPGTGLRPSMRAHRMSFVRPPRPRGLLRFGGLKGSENLSKGVQLPQPDSTLDGALWLETHRRASDREQRLTAKRPPQMRPAKSDSSVVGIAPNLGEAISLSFETIRMLVETTWALV